VANNLRLGEALRQARQTKAMTLRSLAQVTSVSPSFLGRVERGERSPSGHVLRKIAGPLGFDETTLLTLAGIMSPNQVKPETGYLDPYVAGVLSQEPVEVQRIAVSILAIIKTIAERR